MTKPSFKMTKAFYVSMLEKHNITREELNHGIYHYAGGDRDRHLNYYKLITCEKSKLPKHESECVCGVEIVHNCYISKDNKIFIVVGSCCITRFLPKNSSGRTCDTCKIPHRNRIVNKCNNCRTKCRNCCNKVKKDSNDLCIGCTPPPIYVCNDCGLVLKTDYKRCYGCHVTNKTI